MKTNSKAKDKAEGPDVIVGADLGRFPVARPPKGAEMLMARCAILASFSDGQPPEEVTASGYVWRREPGSYWVTKPGDHAFVCVAEDPAEALSVA